MVLFSHIQRSPLTQEGKRDQYHFAFTVKNPKMLHTAHHQYMSMRLQRINTLNEHDYYGNSSHTKTNTTRMSTIITLWVPLTKCLTITCSININEELPLLPTNFISSQWWMQIGTLCSKLQANNYTIICPKFLLHLWKQWQEWWCWLAHKTHSTPKIFHFKSQVHIIL